MRLYLSLSICKGIICCFLLCLASIVRQQATGFEVDNDNISDQTKNQFPVNSPMAKTKLKCYGILSAFCSSPLVRQTIYIPNNRYFVDFRFYLVISLFIDQAIGHLR